MYRILARKYRPKQFADVVEQAHVTTTLKQAIASGKIGQSYLFSGPRGVGKTTIARVLARTLNCINRRPEETQSCGTCDFCKAMDQGNSLDYQEIDGASHRGIDQIRELQSNLPYASAQNHTRVFVIDEAHMLTTEAFNAMLKSLEEPPSKVIFILCTTESAKIPLTIRSRCQHFRFKLVSIHRLMDILKQIIELEGMEAEEEACFAMAKHASGSIRDAQNLLEQVMAYTGATLTGEKVLEALGEVSKDVFYTFLSQLQGGALRENYILIEKMVAAGGSFTAFLYELIQLFSTFVYLQEGLRDSQLLYMSVDEMKRFHGLSQQFRRDEIYKLLDICFEFIQEFKTSTDEHTLRQLAILKLHRYKEMISSAEIAESLKILAQASDLSHPPRTETTGSPNKTAPNSLNVIAEKNVEQKNARVSNTQVSNQVPKKASLEPTSPASPADPGPRDPHSVGAGANDVAAGANDVAAGAANDVAAGAANDVAAGTSGTPPIHTRGPSTHQPVQTTPPATASPVETKPIETGAKPVGVSPAAKTPIATRTNVANPVDASPAAASPVETRSQAAANPIHAGPAANSPFAAKTAATQQTEMLPSWSRETYRALIRHAQKSRHSIAKTLLYLQFQEVNHDGTLVLKEANPRDASARKTYEDFSNALLTYLREQQDKNGFQAIQPITQIKIVVHELTTSMKTIAGVFSGARVIPN